MTRHGSKIKLKRLAAPSTYKAPRKHYKWIVNTLPGPHPKNMAVPLGILLRDILGIAQSMREVKYILRKNYVKIDFKNIRDYRYPVGLMDIIELTTTNKFFRMLPGNIALLEPHEIINKKERNIKPLLIKNKVMISGRRIQLTTHDGRNFVFKEDDEHLSFKPNDTLVYDLDKKRIKEFIKFDIDNLAFVYWGSKRGFLGKIKEIKKVHPLKPKVVVLEANDKVIETISKYVFPIGTESSVIDLGGIDYE